MLVPERLHRLIGLCAGGVVSPADRLLVVLVEGEDEVELVGIVPVTQFEGVVVTSGHIPVQCAEDAFVVVH